MLDQFEFLGSIYGISDQLSQKYFLVCVQKFFDNGKDVTAFILYGALVNSATSAIFGVTSLSAVGFVPWPDYFNTWMTWWIGDSVGILLLTPILLLLHKQSYSNFKQVYQVKAIPYFVILLSILALLLELTHFQLTFNISLLIIIYQITLPANR